MSRLSDLRSRIDSPSRRCRPWLELLEDRWVPSTVPQFDFGKAGSPLRPGYTEVTEASAYSPATGYGWLPGATRLESRDRHVGDALTRDFVFTRDGTFAVDLPNGQHAVTLTMGDAAAHHNQFVYLEGQLVDTLTVNTGDYVTHTYFVNVQDGRLEVRLKELVQGGDLDVNAVINLLEVDTLLDPIFDRKSPEGKPVHVDVTPHGKGLGLPLTYTLLSGPSGASIDAATGELLWNPTLANPPGTYTFSLRAQDSNDPSVFEDRDFTVTLTDLKSELFLQTPSAPTAAVGVDYVLPGFTQYADPTTARLRVNFGDGTEDQFFTLAPDGSFELHHTYREQATYTITLSLQDGARATSTVAVLPAGSVDTIFASGQETVEPGETGRVVLPGPTGQLLDVQFTHGTGTNSDARVFVATYSDAPVDTTRKGTFFDVQLQNATQGNDSLVVNLTLPATYFAAGWDFGYFTPDASAQWVGLRNNEALCHVELLAGPTSDTITMRVTFRRLDFLTGTVFTVALPPSGDTTTGTVRPPQASAGNGGDTSRSLSFTSNAQLALALTASRDNQLSNSSTARGSQAGEASGAANSGALTAGTLNSTAGLGGNSQQPKADDVAVREESASFWKWLQTDEGLMELWLNGIDPAILLQMGVGAETPEAQPWLAAFETPTPPPAMAELSAEESDLWADEIQLAEGDAADVPFVSLALLPVLLAGHAPQRSRRQYADA